MVKFHLPCLYLDHNLIAFGNEAGRLHIIKSEQSDILGNSIDDENESLNIASEWVAHNNAIFDVSWRPDDRWIVRLMLDSVILLYLVHCFS